MPEQDTKTPTVPAPSAPTRAQASDEMGSVAFAGPTPQVRRLVLIPVIGAVIILGVDIVLALQTSAWQLFAAAGFLAIGLALAFRGQQLARRGKFEAAGYWLLAGVSIAYGGAELVLAGMTVYITIGGLLMIVFVTGITRPGKWKAWLIAAGLYAGYILLVNLWQSPLRYDVSNLTIVNLFIFFIRFAWTFI